MFNIEFINNDFQNFLIKYYDSISMPRISLCFVDSNINLIEKLMKINIKVFEEESNNNFTI